MSTGVLDGGVVEEVIDTGPRRGKQEGKLVVIQLWRRMTEGCSMGRTATMEEQQAFTTRQGEHRLLNGVVR